MLGLSEEQNKVTLSCEEKEGIGEADSEEWNGKFRLKISFRISERESQRGRVLQVEGSGVELGEKHKERKRVENEMIMIHKFEYYLKTQTTENSTSHILFEISINVQIIF